MLYILQMSELLHYSHNVIWETNKKYNSGLCRHMQENLKYCSQHLVQQQQKQTTILQGVKY
jgi:hypothetical protein